MDKKANKLAREILYFLVGFLVVIFVLAAALGFAFSFKWVVDTVGEDAIGAVLIVIAICVAAFFIGKAIQKDW